ncbi:MAG: hypothetical protein ACLR4Z_06250 [Butyricicoccaceae bacterium]
MQPQQIPDVLLSLLNVPDLVILAVVLVNLLLGLRRGALASLAGLMGRCIAMAGSYFLARQLAPSAANGSQSRLCRSVFEHKLKQSGVPDALADSVQTALRAAVQSMAEYFLSCADRSVFRPAQYSDLACGQGAPSAPARVTPLGILDALAGGAIGACDQVCCSSCSYCSVTLVLPVTFTGLGYLSPERIENTFLLTKIIAFLPFIAA